jgi:ubiquinone/menaquinone biosynthesis C-methylase UbiE
MTIGHLMAKLSTTNRRWERMAGSDPLWAVLTHSSKRGNRWDPVEFLATGQTDVRETLNQAARLGLFPGNGPAIDVGCGAGRLTLALASQLGEAVGVDFSAAMIHKAEELKGATNSVTFLNIEGSDLRDLPSAKFGLVYSLLALQHMPRSVARTYLADFCRIVAPGGVLIFQLPTGRASGLIGWYGKVLYWLQGPIRKMEMNSYRPHEIESIMKSGGCRLVAGIPDQRAGRAMMSATFFAIRPESAST